MTGFTNSWHRDWGLDTGVLIQLTYFTAGLGFSRKWLRQVHSFLFNIDVLIFIVWTTEKSFVCVYINYVNDIITIYGRLTAIYQYKHLRGRNCLFILVYSSQRAIRYKYPSKVRYWCIACCCQWYIYTVLVLRRTTIYFMSLRFSVAHVYMLHTELHLTCLCMYILVSYHMERNERSLCWIVGRCNIVLMSNHAISDVNTIKHETTYGSY